MFTFHTIITLAYIVPNIYVFARVSRFFINKKFRLHYTLVYFLLFLVYPVSNQFSQGSEGLAGKFLTCFANYLLPFWLYLFLLVLVFDIFNLANLIFKLIPKEKLQNTKFKVTGLSVILSLSALVVVAGIINFNTIRTSVYTIEIPAKSAEIRRLMIAFVADFHLKNSTSIDFVERFAKSIRNITPDLMIFGGDIVEGDRNDGNMEKFEHIIAGIKARYGVFAVFGNHEHYAGQSKVSFFEKAGMKVLCDTTIVIAESFNLTGRNDGHLRDRKSMDELLKSVADTLPEILIDHRPTEIDKVSTTSVDVQLSGHTHNGQLFPINLITGRVYKLSWGYKKIGNTHFFVTSGIRLWGPPVRTTGKSEIMVINVNFVKNGAK